MSSGGTGGRGFAAPRVGTIVVNHNGGALVGAAVASALGQSLPPHRVVLVDSASTDGSGDLVGSAFPEVELVRLAENVGFAAASNLGIEMLDDCELVWLLNPDATAAPDWLERIVDAAAHNPEYASFGGTIEMADGSGRIESAGDVYHVYGTAWPRFHGRPSGSPIRQGDVFGSSGAAVLYRRESLLRAGGFDERYFCYFEDVDLNLRLQLAGGRALCVPEAVVAHVGGVSSCGRSDFAIYHSQRNLVWSFVKSSPPHLFWRYLPMHLLLNLGSILTYAPRGHGKTVLRAKWDALRGLPAMVRARRAVMRTADFDRRVFDSVLRRGPRALLTETRGLRPLSEAGRALVARSASRPRARGLRPRTQRVSRP